MSKQADQTSTYPTHDFALIVSGIDDLTPEMADKLYEAGCDDATLSMKNGIVHMQFNRRASSIQEAIVSAIKQVNGAGIGADVVRVDECNLVTMAEIARRVNRTRQMVLQYILGQRGPGHFPPPECFITDDRPLWPWCAVSYWFVQNNLIKPEQGWNAEVVFAINNALDMHHQQERQPDLVERVNKELGLTP